MDLDAPLPLLGGLSPARFMQKHWQKKPLLVRGALAEPVLPLPRGQLFELAARDDVESRLVVRDGARWRVRQGPLPRRALPPLKRRGWTLLVQGLDTQVDAARALLDRFRFVPDARLDDLMLSWASPGGGVGPHVDSYDVFLLQLQGARRWRVGRVRQPVELVDGAPLKLLRQFEPEHDWLLQAGDLLYLPPLWGHDGVAEAGDDGLECVTASVGFRAPGRDELARELLLRLADALAEGAEDSGGGRPRATAHAADTLYRDPRQPAVATPAALPQGLLAFAQDALRRALDDPDALPRALGEVLSEPKPLVWFEAQAPLPPGCGVRLDRRTRMLHDARHVFINGEAFRAGGRDAVLMGRLADARALSARDVARLSADAQALLSQWVCAGWAQAVA